MIDPLTQGVQIAAPWGLVIGYQDPQGMTIQTLMMAHNTKALYDLAKSHRSYPLTEGWSYRTCYVVRDIVELPVHQHGFITIAQGPLK